MSETLAEAMTYVRKTAYFANSCTGEAQFSYSVSCLVINVFRLSTENDQAARFRSDEALLARVRGKLFDEILHEISSKYAM
jgi:hypothetical protein